MAGVGQAGTRGVRRGTCNHTRPTVKGQASNALHGKAWGRGGQAGLQRKQFRVVGSRASRGSNEHKVHSGTVWVCGCLAHCKIKGGPDRSAQSIAECSAEVTARPSYSLTSPVIAIEHLASQPGWICASYHTLGVSVYAAFMSTVIAARHEQGLAHTTPYHTGARSSSTGGVLFVWKGRGSARESLRLKLVFRKWRRRCPLSTIPVYTCKAQEPVCVAVWGCKAAGQTAPNQTRGVFPWPESMTQAVGAGGMGKGGELDPTTKKGAEWGSRRVTNASVGNRQAHCAARRNPVGHPLPTSSSLVHGRSAAGRTRRTCGGGGGGGYGS